MKNRTLINLIFLIEQIKIRLIRKICVLFGSFFGGEDLAELGFAVGTA
jgi:hypothetical protein